MKGKTNAHIQNTYTPSESVTVNVKTDGVVLPEEFEVTISELTTIDGYTCIEYIESTGSQYIDTGFKPNQDTRIVAKLTCPVISGATTWALGARLTSSEKMFGFVTGSSGYYRTQYGSTMNNIDTSYNTSEPFVLDKNKETTFIDGEIVATASAQTFYCPVNLTLCALNNNGTINYGSIKLYSCKIYDNDILIRDFVPVLRSDGIAGLYDILNKTFYKSCGTSDFVSGNIVNEIIAVQTTTTATYKIPYGTQYLVSASTITGYKTPQQQIFVSSQPNRSVSILYERIYMGVYIQGVSGALYAEDEWDEQETANGIAVITDNCRFVIALEDAHSSNCRWGGYHTTVNNITTTMNTSTAIADYNGEIQTTTIINQLTGTNDGYVDGAPAAEYCRAYTFPNGSIGYLGAAGEWKTVLNNYSAILSALIKCGGTVMNRDYWTSTQYNSNDSWWLYWNYSRIGYSAKIGTYYVRAFAAI